MDNHSKIKQLRKIIIDSLSPIIDNDYIYIDLPFYQNIGDILIWEGTEHFLASLPYKCLYKASIETFNNPNLSNDTIILLQGGGNFGDLWIAHQDFRLRIIKEYPNNKIIILPQTVYYNNLNKIKEEAIVFHSHKNLTICVRDCNSFNLLREYNVCKNIMLLPDMAFCIPTKILYYHRKKTKNSTLFIRRKDKELQDNINYNNFIKQKGKIISSDWPTYENENDPIVQKFWMLKDISIEKWKEYAEEIFKPHLIKKGVEFISPHEKIYSTRLHGAILSILLDKPTFLFDNSYGKNYSFYETWLKQTKGINLYDKEDKDDIPFIKRIIKSIKELLLKKV